jgi:hypothetical protein
MKLSRICLYDNLQLTYFLPKVRDVKIRVNSPIQVHARFRCVILVTGLGRGRPKILVNEQRSLYENGLSSIANSGGFRH